MKAFAEYHAHSTYSRDAKSTMREMVCAAIALGYTTFGLSDHGFKHYGYGVRYDDYPKMRAELDALQEEFPQIRLKLGVEANILDDRGTIDVDARILDYVDYVNAGYHFGSMPQNLRGIRNHINNRLKLFRYAERDYNTRALVHAMERNRIFILTHPGDKGIIDTKAVARAAERTGTVLEINAHHNNLSLQQLLEVKTYDVQLSVGSDAHRADHLKQITSAIDRAQMAGIPKHRIINVK